METISKRGRPRTRTACRVCGGVLYANGYCREHFNEYQRNYNRRTAEAYREMKRLFIEEAREEVAGEMDALRAQLARTETFIGDIQTENRQLRESIGWYEERLAEAGK